MFVWDGTDVRPRPGARCFRVVMLAILELIFELFGDYHVVWPFHVRPLAPWCVLFLQSCVAM